jgi:RimJ/RimL family protein N-acetyltransferase
MKLVPFTTPLLQALTRGRAAFREVSGLEPAFDWPHPDFADALEFLLELHAVDPASAEWIFLVVVDGLVVGDVGAKGAPVEGAVEVGYGIAASQRRSGLATAALAAFLAHCGAHGVHTVTADCDERNAGSIRVLERAGFTQTGSRTDGGQRLLCWVRRA